jgi:hypothetical protein
MKVINEELNYIKYLFAYQRGKVISEQKTPPTLEKDGCEKGFYRDCTTKECVEKPKNTIVVYTQEDFDKYKNAVGIAKKRNAFTYELIKKGFVENPGNLPISRLTWVVLPKIENPNWAFPYRTKEYNKKTDQNLGLVRTGRWWMVNPDGIGTIEYKILNPILGCLSDTPVQPVTTQKQENITSEAKDLTITCDLNQRQTGNKGDSNNNYIGYEYNGHTYVTSGDTITINLDSFTIPDAFYIKYGEKEHFSGFRGSVAYENRNFQNELNSFSDLKTKIQQVITRLGGSIIVEDKHLVIKEKGPWSKPLDINQKIPVKIIVFSPLDKTEFKISATCYDV